MIETTLVLAQATKAADAGGASLRDIFFQSFDTFSVLLILGSLVAGTVIVRVALEVRQANILPDDTERTLRRLVGGGNLAELRGFVERDDSFVSRVLLAGVRSPGTTAAAIREAAELAASEEASRWFRKVEPLNIVGNLGPLLGLAGTVWGMVIAFMSLNQMGGQATASSLSLGISKALFHTLLGLMLAIPSLAVFGYYRMRVDRLCTRAMVVSSELTEQLIAHATGSPAAKEAAAGAAAAGRAMAGVRHSAGDSSF